MINTVFRTRFINISPAKTVSDIGKFKITKLTSAMAIYLRAMVAFRQFKPDLVYLTLTPHGFAFYKDGLIALMLKLLGAKLVYHLHGKGIALRTTDSRLQFMLYRLAFKDAAVIHLSECLFHDVAAVRDPTKPIVAVPNGTDRLNCPGRTSASKKIKFIFLSNLIPAKGADVLISAAMLIPEHLQSKFQVTIFGSSFDESYEEMIRETVNANPHRNILLNGPIYEKDKIRALCESHVFVLPTRYENECFPISILEAMSAGLAVISTDEGAISEIIHDGTTGLVIRDCNPEELAAAMQSLIENPAEAERLGRNGSERFEKHFRTDIFEENIVRTLTSLLG